MSYDTKEFATTYIRRAITVAVLHTVYTLKTKCDTQTKFSDIVKTVAAKLTGAVFTGEDMPMTLESFEKDALEVGDVTEEQLQQVKNGTHQFLLACVDDAEILDSIITIPIVRLKTVN